jgi:hypothetical protein
VLIHQLPAESATSRALNDGQPPWSNEAHRIADLWALWAKQDHPVRAEIQAKAQAAAKTARVIELKARFQKLKHAYGLEDSA